MTPQQANELPECPFCKSSVAPRVFTNVDLGCNENTEFFGYTVSCDATRSSGGCGANCGFHENVAEAIAAWKRRAPAPTSEPGARDAVVEANRALLLERSQIGIKKYGGTLTELAHPRRVLMQHLLEELLDAANYIQADLQREDIATPAVLASPLVAPAETPTPKLELTDAQIEVVCAETLAQVNALSNVEGGTWDQCFARNILKAAQPAPASATDARNGLPPL